MIRLTSAALLVAALAGAGFPARAADCSGKEIRSRVLPVRYKPVAEAAQLVDQLLGPCGAYRVPKSLRVITVEDEPDRLERIAEALASWDTPPQAVEVTVSLILATRETEPREGLAGELREVSDALAEVTGWTRFERIASATARTVEGGAIGVDLGERYRAELEIAAVDTDRGIVEVRPFVLEKRPAPREAGTALATPRPILTMELDLPEGRLHLVGAPARRRGQALFIALEVNALGPPVGGGEGEE
ncbi:MAG: hypothetical protein D6718_07310 [Acidobacteria bacterium]|nr:MAG: hypothetical protein D6718_07310 [Acidobacteriota bacterium]